MKIGYCVIVTLEGVVLNNMAESCTPSTCEETDTEETDTGKESNSIARLTSCSTSSTSLNVLDKLKAPNHSESTSSTTLNVLDKLKAPKQSEICRKRKVQTNPPPVGKKRSFCVGKYDPHSVRPSLKLHKKKFDTTFFSCCRTCFFNYEQDI